MSVTIKRDENGRSSGARDRNIKEMSVRLPERTGEESEEQKRAGEVEPGSCGEETKPKGDFFLSFACSKQKAASWDATGPGQVILETEGEVLTTSPPCLLRSTRLFFGEKCTKHKPQKTKAVMREGAGRGVMGS